MTDVGQPYTASQWQSNFGNSETPLVIDENQSSTGFFSLFHDSWNAFPTFVLIDHTMTVRVKPWTLDNNSNTNPCDGSNNTIDGFSGGDTQDFIQQLVNECGVLCEACSDPVDSDGDGIGDDCDDCFNMSGDVNEDAIIDILDIVNVVNIILNGGINSPDFSECQLSNANFNDDATINVLDIIQIINAILDNSARIDMNVTDNGSSLVALDDSSEDLNINISSDADITGIEISFYTDYLLDVVIDQGRSDVQLHTNIHNGIQKVIVFSIENIPFTNNELDVNIENGSSLLTADDLDIVVASRSGDNVSVSYVETAVKSFQLDKIYPNPFNPSTTVQYDVEKAGNLNISVYNILGQKVAELYNGHQSYGNHMLRWDATNMSSGVYYINMELNGQVENNKVMLVK